MGYLNPLVSWFFPLVYHFCLACLSKKLNPKLRPDSPELVSWETCLLVLGFTQALLLTSVLVLYLNAEHYKAPRFPTMRFKAVISQVLSVSAFSPMKFSAETFLRF